MQTGTVIDFYDDPSGTVLKTKLAFAQLPDYIRQADYQSEEKLAALPDDAFALVMVDQGNKIRKFACVDKGNTALSTLYFLENKDKLPEEAQKVAAANLVEYCQAFEIEPPWQLQKTAEHVTLTHAGKPMPSAERRELSQELFGGKKKSADLTGSEVMPLQSNPNKEADADSQLNATDEKKAGVSDLVKKMRITSGKLNAMKDFDKKVQMHIPKDADHLYVNTTGKSPPPKFEKKAHTRYCLEKLGQGRFPIDSYGEVLEANKWFEENGKSLHPQERREYCTKLAARADELHISVTDNIMKYAGKNFASADDVRASVCTRMQFWVDDAPERDALRGMLDKYASASPDQFCIDLTAFDVQHGLDQYWDDFIVDPVACVFGMEKRAEWLWEQGADRLTQDQLQEGVHDSQKIHALKAKFGPELASEIVEKPSEVFDSLPLDSKRIIARILNDTQ